MWAGEAACALPSEGDGSHGLIRRLHANKFEICGPHHTRQFRFRLEKHRSTDCVSANRDRAPERRIVGCEFRADLFAIAGFRIGLPG
jgi:hypothetical protein